MLRLEQRGPLHPPPKNPAWERTRRSWRPLNSTSRGEGGLGRPRGVLCVPGGFVRVGTRGSAPANGVGCAGGRNARQGGAAVCGRGQPPVLLLLQSKSNLNPDAKEFVPGVKY